MKDIDININISEVLTSETFRNINNKIKDDIRSLHIIDMDSLLILY